MDRLTPEEFDALTSREREDHWFGAAGYDDDDGYAIDDPKSEGYVSAAFDAGDMLRKQAKGE